MEARDFVKWLDGYLASACGDPPTSGLGRKDVEIVLAKLKSVADDDFGENFGAMTGPLFGGIDRNPLPFWRNQFMPKSDPTAVPSTDDVVEELKQQYQKTTFHHSV